jgi:hypothetical protein
MPKITQTKDTNASYVRADVMKKPAPRRIHYKPDETAEDRKEAKSIELKRVAIKKLIRGVKDDLLCKVIPPITKSRVEVVRTPIVKAPSADLTARRDRIAIILKKCAIEEIRASRELLAMRMRLNAPY